VQYERFDAPGHRDVTAERRGLRRGVYLLPSLFTVANLFCGWACVVYAIRGDFATAAPFIGFAIVLDMLDGRIARMTGTSSAFGVEFDSLADLISFGMAPAVLVFQWSLLPLGRLGWAVGFLYLTAAALRLARFNIQPVADKRYFVGMPSPAAAGVPAATVFYYPAGFDTLPEAYLGLAILLAVALLMVSTIRFKSFKTFDLRARRRYQWLVLLAGLLALIATYPQAVLVVAAYTYLVSPFVGYVVSRFRRKGSARAAEAVAVADQPAPDSATAPRPPTGPASL
jgi:CDP-diacylglycerol---serine O-phosphatidyltransferase